MRGATRIQVNVLLAGSGALAGGLVGFAVGIIPLPDVPFWVAIPAALLDALGVPTLSVRRQVPQYWGRIFSPQLTAVLYGTRLGVGPLTILPTWLWWAATAVGVSRGPWAGAAAGMTFAVARTITMWVVGTRARHLDSKDRAIRVGFAVVALATLAACSGDDDDDDGAAATTTTSVPELALEPATTTTTTPEDTALLDLLLDDDAVPELTRDRDETLDLDAAAETESDVEAERALLETRGFVRGAARRWLGPSEDVIFVTAYEFAAADQADLYLVDGTETVLARGAEQVDVPDVPGAVGFRTVDGDFEAHAIAFTRGTRWFLVVGGSSIGTIDLDDVQRLAAAQAALVG